MVKPISFERFLKSIEKGIARLDNSHPEVAEIKEVQSGTIAPDYIFVKDGTKLIKINLSEILYIEGLKDYVIIKNENSRVITLQTMKSLEDKLPAQIFKRIHRSFIVNLNRILAVDGSVVEVMEKGQVKQLPIGKNYKDELLDLINVKKI